MKKDEKRPEGLPSGEADALSATGMFLSALGSDADQPSADPVWPENTTRSGPERKESSGNSTGEFTRMFRSTEGSRTPSAGGMGGGSTVPAAASARAASPQQGLLSDPAPVSGPGEFTRIFVKPSDIPPASAARPIPDLSPLAPASSALASGAPRMKGFSSGASDSASAEGSHTQAFQSRTPSHSMARSQGSSAGAEQHSPSYPARGEVRVNDEFNWSKVSDSTKGDKFGLPPADMSEPRGTGLQIASSSGHQGLSPSATNLLGSLASSPPQQPQSAPYRSEPYPAYDPSPPVAPTPIESGGVTRMIQRLSEDLREFPRAETPKAVPHAPTPALHSTPGEFTRMTAIGDFGGGPMSPAVIPAAPPVTTPATPPAKPAFAASPMPSPAMPPIPKPVVKLEAPALPAPPAMAAPQGKFQGMVPFLLVVNTFLLLVMIVLVIFLIKGR